MEKLVSAKCPNCGAALKLSKEEEKVKCEYCQNTIIVDDAIACYKLKISGKVSVEGITTNSDLIEAANELLGMKEYLKAKRKFLEFSEKCPNDYQGWLGLLICRTRDFTIKDNNNMFENDINNYYEHFLSVAPEDIKKQYNSIIEAYLNPNNQDSSDITTQSNKTKSNIPWLWILGWIWFFPIPLTILIWKSKINKTLKIVITALLWLLIIAGLAASKEKESKNNLQKQSYITNISTNLTI